MATHFGRFLAAECTFSYGTLQTVNLLALRLQWFESTPAHASTQSASVLAWLKP